MATTIAMWLGPRNISTALLRSFGNRPDCHVTDEPFYAHYLHKTGVDHPLRDEVIAAGKTDWYEIVHWITEPVPDGKEIWYQKQMAQHNLSGMDLQWAEKMQNCFLIRHPREVIISYSKKFEIKSVQQLGYPQQAELYELLAQNAERPPIVLDAKDILVNPKELLILLCIELGIPFYDEMLSWPKGRRETDGIWGKHWYGNVEKSTGFQPYIENNKTISPEYQSVYEECMEHYQLMYQHRLKN